MVGKSPRFRLTKANIPATVKSAWISALAVFVVSVLTQVPYIEFGDPLIAIVVTGISGFMIHLAKEWVEEK